METKDAVIIVAGGRGLRMGGDIPKQFVPIGGRPILMRTIERFRSYSAELSIIVVLSKEQQDYWRALCKEYDFRVVHTLADGGETRFHSVKNGLSLIPDTVRGVVGVHDGVRPFPSVEVIAACYDEARRSGAALPVIPVVETLRHINGRNVLRSDYMLVQTPQTFDISLLKRAYHQPYTDAFTDDATVVESLGHNVTTVEGNRENIKITTPFDLKIAETLV